MASTNLLKIKNFSGLLIILVLALLLRLTATAYLGNDITGVQQAHAHDQVSYDALAQSLLAGRGYSFEQDWYPGFTKAGVQTAHWSFLYPLYLAGVYTLTGYAPLAARLVQALVSGALCIVLIYRLGKRLVDKQVGLVAAGLGAVYAYFVFYDAALMTESFFTLGILAMFELSFELVGIGRTKDEVAPTRRLSLWLLLGVVLGLTTLLRQTLLLFLPIWLVWIYWAGRKKIAWYGPLISLGVLAACILPWTVRNYTLYNAFLPLNSNAGYAFYSANHPDHGIQFDQDYAAPLPDDLIGKGLNEAQWNTALTQRGLQFIFDDPWRYMLLSLDRVPIFFNAWFSSESGLSSNLVRVLSFGLYLPFFVYGLVLSLHDARRFMLIYLFILVFSAMHILIWASVRYRLPMDALMMPLAAMAVVDLMQRLDIQLPGRISL